MSIVVNNYNYARFLRGAIDSALAQTHAPSEVIVVDDGSTDESRSIIAGYGDRVTAVLQENQGQAAACNAGLRASRGEVVVFLDADDLLAPQAAAGFAPFFGDARVSKVHWPMRVIDERGRETGAIHPRAELPEGDLRERVIHGGPMSHVSPPTSGNAWARWFLDSVFPIHDYGDKHGADAYLIPLAPLCGLIRRAPEPLGFYREHGGNFSGRTRHLRNQRYLRRYERECRMLAEFLERRGVSVDPGAWMGANTPYEWMRATNDVSAAVEAVVAPGETFILVDEDQWGEPWGQDKVVEGRRTLPFLERDGEYFGPPADDASAILELQRLRAAGARFLVIVWPAFWWLDHYTGFREYLHATYPLRLQNDRVIIFDLGG